MKEQFQKSGFLIEKALFSKQECKDILEGIRSEDYLTTPSWSKSSAVAIPSWAAIAKNDRFVDRIETLIGENVILWGAKLAERVPGQAHQWHNDLESAGSDGFVSVWMGIENTEPVTSLKVVPGSHQAPQLLVQYAVDQGIAENGASYTQVTPDFRLLNQIKSYLYALTKTVGLWLKRQDTTKRSSVSSSS